MSRSNSLKPEEVLITSQLYQRPARPAALDTELAAHRELSSLMTVDPVLAIQRFLDLALELCPSAGSAGLSELSTEDDETLFRWTAMSGAFKPHVGGTTPRDFSPCGLCLDHHHTILVERPARVFTYFNEAEPAIHEGLVVPLYDTGKRPLGTLWVTSHEADQRFDPTDARVIEQLAVQLVLAIKLRRKAKIALQLEEVARDREILVEEVRHRVKNMIQMTAGLLRLQERGAQLGEVRTALREAQNRLLVLSGVYEALLAPGADTQQVEVSALIERLVDALRQAAPADALIRLTAECDELWVDVAKAVPLGLIVNEAVTNALKHAFGPRQSGEVTVRLKRDGAACSLSICDNGRGFDRPSRDGSLGATLMKSLARQVAGRLTFDGSNGATVLLEWTSSKHRARSKVEASVT